MKAGKPHTVYLAEQALDILTTLKTCFPSSKYVHPSRYDSAKPLSPATLNRAIAAAVDRINEDRKADQEQFLPVSVHDLRRTQPRAPRRPSAGSHAGLGGHDWLLDARRSNASTVPPSAHARSLPSLPPSTRLRSVDAQAAECHPFEPRCPPRTRPRDQRASLSDEASSQPSIAPTSMPSGWRCRTFVSGTSSATLFLPKQWLVCCADRLNPPPSAELERLEQQTVIRTRPVLTGCTVERSGRCAGPIRRAARWTMAETATRC